MAALAVVAFAVAADSTGRTKKRAVFPIRSDGGAFSLNCLAVAPGRLIMDANMTPRFADMIDIWGADHGGYVKRMAAAVRACSLPFGVSSVAQAAAVASLAASAHAAKNGGPSLRAAMSEALAKRTRRPPWTPR